MKILAINPALSLLSGCAGTAQLDLCKYASLRRATYTSAIIAADAYIASGQPVPASMRLGREAAATALLVLNANCPVPTEG